MKSKVTISRVQTEAAVVTENSAHPRPRTITTSKRPMPTVFTPETARYPLMSENILGAALLRSGRPVLYLPEDRPETGLGRALIAWVFGPLVFGGFHECLRERESARIFMKGPWALSTAGRSPAAQDAGVPACPQMLICAARRGSALVGQIWIIPRIILRQWVCPALTRINGKRPRSGSVLLK